MYTRYVVLFIIVCINVYANYFLRQYEFILYLVFSNVKYLFIIYILWRAFRITISYVYPKWQITIPKQRWPALDGLRLIAFFLVFLHHFPPFYSGNFVLMSRISETFNIQGWIGVDIFLTLSSFLLTYLGIREIENTGGFSILSFIIRRILRIWPLYFFFLIYNYVNSLHFEEGLLTFGRSLAIHIPYFLIFIGNFSYFSRRDVFPENIGHLWTISLEEQYYVLICIGILFYNQSKNRFFLYFGSLFLIGCVSKITILYFKVEYPAIWVLPIAKLDTISIGGLTALIVWRLENIQHIVLGFEKKLNFIILILLISIVVVPDPRSITLNNWITSIIPSVLTSMLIIQSTRKESLIARILSLKPLELLGRITFGLYIFHFIGINIASQFFNYYKSEVNIVNYILFLVLSFIITISIALISYFGLELAFLRKKTRLNWQQIILKKPL